MVAAGPSAGGLAGSSDAVLRVAREVADALVKRDYAAVEARFDDTMKKALPGEKLRETIEQVVMMSGKFLRVETARTSMAHGLDVVVLPLVYEHATWDLKVVLDAQRHVAGMFIIPGTAGVAWDPPTYGRAETIEAPIKVGPGALPGLLLLPWGKGPFPAVVLVHGSGPHDADETIGPNKTFRDLALGLAARGIASVRYEKRTHAHPEEFAPARKYTVAEETIDDAVAAAQLAAAAPAVDAHRVWIVGHSLGGFLAPRIAARAPGVVAGIVSLAGSTRPLEELVMEQMRYLEGEGSPGAAKADAFAKAVRDPALSDGQVVDMLGAKLPGSYFLDLRRYDPGRTAAGLRVPILILQGERDYQVRRADYDGWTKALAGHANARFRLYPALNHLFEAGEGESRPAEYLRPSMHVDPEVITEVAAFILKA
jgi:dienelactone hydrolase